MEKTYIYNLKRHTLHIEGFCPHTFKGIHYGNDYKCFRSEDEAVKYDGRAVSFCKKCAQKRDAILRKEKV